MSRPDVLVIGAGVSGLTTAVCLAEAGLAVRVHTRHPLQQTTSCSAGAIWGPYLVADDRIAGWSEQTRVALGELAGDGATGVRLVHGLEASRASMPPPGWAAVLDGFRPATGADLPDGYASGWWYTAPVVDMPVYLSYLAARLADAGGTVALSPVSSLAQAVALAPVAVNCAGAGARDLVPDPALTPTRGQLVMVENPGLDQFFVEHDESTAPTYYLPQGGHVALGGSAEPGRTDLAPDAALADAIRRRCAVLEPSLRRARVLTHRVGLRPSRGRVRLERTRVGGGHVVHNYGHGGAGVTLSWGCAQEVLRLVTGAGPG
jgi:D-amino-acid oxidase